MNAADVLQRLSATLAARKGADPATSYTARLFAKGPDSILKKIGEESAEVIMAAKDADPATSYTARLFAKGPDSILKKIGEESAEVIMAAKDGQRGPIICESADLVYHLLALLAFYDMGIDEVAQELARREGVSGIEEKNSRK